MFKIDWPCAVGGALVGYYAKGKVEAVKHQFKGIYTGAIETLKESFSDEASKSPEQQAAEQRLAEVDQKINQLLQGNNAKNGKNG